MERGYMFLRLKKEREKIKDRYEKYIDDFFRKFSLLSD